MPKSRQTHIFATKSDLMPGLKNADSELGIIYVRADGLRTEPNFEHFDSLLDWHDLGTNTTGDYISGPRIFVMPKQSKLKIQRVPQLDGGIRYALDQLRNPKTVSFLPGGIYNEQRAIVCGHIGTASQSHVSIALYKSFVRIVTASFEKIGQYRVGPEAARLMDDGYRMVTISLSSPSLYDLRRAPGR